MPSIPSLEVLFERYRSQGDVRALAEVFDRSAPHLRKVARHLARSRHEADDLVQSTFVVAIERAASFDATRLLVPWLTGILARQAVALRRREDRPPVVPIVTAAADPSASAIGREVEEHVEVALAALSSADRSVLLPFLRDNKGPGEIAGELGCRPGAARMRLMRGLARLRALLPASLGLSLLATLGAPWALGQMRRHVLAHAALRAGSAPVAASATLTTSAALVLNGVSIVSKGAILGGAALASLTAGLAWHLSGSPTAPRAVPPEPAGKVSLALENAVLAPAPDAVALPPERATPVVEASAVASRSERKIGSLSLVVHLTGLHPEDVAGAHFSVAAEEPTTTDTATDEAPGSYSDGVQLEEGHIIRASLWINALHASGLDSRYFRDAEIQTPPVVIASGSPPSPERIEFDLSAWARDAEHAACAQLIVQGVHELYFEGENQLELPPGWHARVAGGEDVALETEMELRPAAVVRGKMPRKDTLQFGMAGRVRTTYVTEGAPPTDFREEVYVSVGTTLNLTDLNDQLVVMSAGALMFYSGSSDIAALFPLLGGAPDPEPAAATTCGQDGSFELKVAEAGLYAFLAARAAPDRPVTEILELELRTLTDLGDLELAPGESILGLVHGILPEHAGAYTVRAERESCDGDVAIETQGQALLWSGGAFEWPRGDATPDEQGRFEIGGLGRAVHTVGVFYASDLDARTPREVRPAGEAVASVAPAVGLELALPVVFLDVVFARDGIPLQELEESGIDPWAAQDLDGDGSEDPLAAYVLEVRTAEGDMLGQLDAARLARATIVVDPGVPYDLWLVRGTEIRKRKQLQPLAAGARAREVFEVPR